MKLRFTIRDLLWLTLVVGLAVGWWLDHKRLTGAHYSFTTEAGGSRTVLLDNDSGESWERHGSEWVQRY
jgi:hypothetical protein